VGLKFDPDRETLVETDHPLIAPCLRDVDKLDFQKTLMPSLEVFGHHGKATESNGEQTEEGQTQPEKEERNERREANSTCETSKSKGRLFGKNGSCCPQ
jgi:hypothetical protein